MNHELKQDLNEQWKIFRRILGYVKPYSTRLIFGIIASVLSGIFGFSPVLLLKYLFDYVIPKENLQLLYVYCFIIVAVFFVKSVANYGQSYLMSWVGQNVIMDMRKSVFRHLTGLPIRFFKENKAGELISRVISDISLMEVAVSRVLGRFVLSFFSFIPPIIAVFYISWKLTLLSLIVLPLTLYPILKFAQKLKKVSTTGQKNLATITSTMAESFYGIQILKAFTMEEFERNRFNSYNREYYNAQMKAARVSALSSPLMEMIGACAAALVFGFGLRSVINGNMTIGTLIAFLTSLFMMYDPIKKISSLNYDIQRAVAGAERIFELIDTKSDIVEVPDPIDLDNLDGTIACKNISFSYNQNEPVLNEINLSINSGETLAIVGSSGVGKSTLVNLIPRFYDPVEGSVLIDNHDIKLCSLNSVRKNIGIVTQETILFNDTIENNLTYGRNDFSKFEIEEAARNAYAHDFIMELPLGYQTVIGERGVNLSGGQRQRLAIARALLKNPPILILDEATSSLDSESEFLIQKALDQLMKNRTTIVIAHRLSTIRKANRIAVMENGRIVEIGNHEYLMSLGGVYRHLHSFQFSDSESD